MFFQTGTTERKLWHTLEVNNVSTIIYIHIYIYMYILLPIFPLFPMLSSNIEAKDYGAGERVPIEVPGVMEVGK